MTDLLIHIRDNVSELIDPFVHGESYHTWSGRNRVQRRHVTQHPSLLDQLQDLVDPTNTTNADPGAATTPDPAPAANLYAIDLLSDIQYGAIAWMRHARIVPRPHMKENLRALVGFAAASDTDTLGEIARDVASWHRRARVACGWDSAPYTPEAPCPNPECEAPPRPQSGLRIRIDGEAAWCLSCGTSWDSTTIGVLKNHIANSQSHAYAESSA